MAPTFSKQDKILSRTGVSLEQEVLPEVHSNKKFAGTGKLKRVEIIKDTKREHVLPRYSNKNFAGTGSSLGLHSKKKFAGAAKLKRVEITKGTKREHVLPRYTNFYRF